MRWLVVLLTSVAGPAHAADLYGDIAEVAKELHAGDPGTRRDAIDKLDAYRNDEVRPYLLGALDDGDLDVRVKAANAIGRRKLGDATGRMVGLMGDAEPRLRAAAATALGELAAQADPPWPERAGRALERALGDAEPEVREAAVTAIGALPRALQKPAAVAVTGRLDDERPPVRQKAALVLARLGDARAVIPLVGRLSDGSREVRMAALEALGELGDERAAPAMIRMLSDNADEVRAQAVQSLGRLRARAAVAPLVDLLERGPEALRGRAAVALGQVASAKSQPEDPAVAALVRALGRDELRLAAREGLRLAGPAAVEPLCARVPSATGEELQIEIELVGELGDQRAALVLKSELQRGRIGRDKLVEALGKVARGRRELQVELTALLADPEAAVRRRAARALSGNVDSRATAALAEAATDSDREVRLFAIGELGRLKAKSAQATLAHALAGNDLETAAAAAHALGQIGAGDKSVGPALEAALGRSDKKLRREAADALVRLGDSSLVPAVMRRARTGGAERAEALAALAGLLRGRPDPVARELFLSYAEGTDLGLGAEALDGLAAMHDPQSAPRLLRLTSRKEVELRRHLCRALGELASDDAEAALATRLADDPDEGVRAEAAWALGKTRGGAAARAALERALFAPSAAVRGNAAAAFARLGHPPDALSRLLHDPDAAVRADAERARAGGARPGHDWIGLYVVDFDGAPLPGAHVRLHLPDGLIKLGETDAHGLVREESLPAGGCQLELVDEPPGRS